MYHNIHNLIYWYRLECCWCLGVTVLCSLLIHLSSISNVIHLIPGHTGTCLMHVLKKNTSIIDCCVVCIPQLCMYVYSDHVYIMYIYIGNYNI